MSDYLNLPESIKQNYSYEQYLCLTDLEKALLVQHECEPETFKD